MGFSHTTVAKLLDTTQAGIAAMKHDDNGDYTDSVIFEDIYMRKPLADFCAEIRRTNKHVKFGLANKKRWAFANGTPRTTHVWLYYDGDQYAVGRISVPQNPHDEVKYMTYAPAISNERYRGGGEEYHTLSSTQLSRAMKNVRTYLRRYSPQDVANISASTFMDNVSSRNYDFNSKVRDVKYKVVDDIALHRELKHLLNIGHQFVDSRYREHIEAYFSLLEEVQERATRAVHGLHVTLSESTGQQVWTVVRANDMKQYISLTSDTPVETYVGEDVPADIMEKVASLSLLDDRQYVEGLGMKVSNTEYWVLA